MAQDHSAQGNASQMPKRIQDITKMKATEHRIVGKAILPETSKRLPRSYQLNARTGTAKQRTRSTKLHTTVETSLDPT
jgi:hypothetical protein